jgi:hypothetical protein
MLLHAGQQLVGHHRPTEPDARGVGEGDPPPRRRALVDPQLAFLLRRIVPRAPSDPGWG